LLIKGVFVNKKLLAMITFFILENAVVCGMPGIPMHVDVECEDDDACAFEGGPAPRFYTHYMQDGDRNCKITTCRCKGVVRTTWEEGKNVWGKKCFRYDSHGEDYFKKIFDILAISGSGGYIGLVNFDQEALIKRLVSCRETSFIKKYTACNDERRPYEKTLMITTRFNENGGDKKLYVDIVAESRELPFGRAQEKRWQLNCCGINRCCFYSETEENL
jgi:hypothetical protein